MRVGIVNDLALACEILRRLVMSVPGHSVAWLAVDGADAVKKTAADRPDVILMDLVMPVMDGAEATRRIMAATPCPILLVTSNVCTNYNLVYKAMGFGGLDAVNTPKFGPGAVILEGEGILARLAKLERAKSLSSIPISRSQAIPQIPASRRTNSLLAIGASTGGPDALRQILAGLPSPFPAAIVVVQHIAADYAPSLTQWLQTQISLKVGLAREGEVPKSGEVYLACSNDHLTMRSDRSFGYSVEPADYPYRPSVDVFFESLLAHWPATGTAVLLTGMGNDGALGLARLRRAGWWTIAQDRASCVVYGMPKAAVELDAASEVVGLSGMAKQIRARFGD